MALTLFEPFIIRRLEGDGGGAYGAQREEADRAQTDEVWDILEEVTRDKTVMLNRAPTLHRLSIQSFEPVLVEGEAIQIHPLVCTAFNADFDGDQMAVHVPLSIEAQLESRLLMLASTTSSRRLRAAVGDDAEQDIALGIYYMTTFSQRDKQLARKRAGSGMNTAPGSICRFLPILQRCIMAHAEGAVQDP
jgi:DNA-directed RNA polymerase subunit beta'